MKIVKSLSLFALAAVLLTACNDKSKDGNVDTDATSTDTTAVDTTMAKETAANLETTTFKIDGMTCPMGCAATIEKKLAKMEGVGEAKVDYEKKTATVSYDPAKQTPEKFVETVEGLADGAYKVSDVHNSADKAYNGGGGDKDKDKKKKRQTRRPKKLKLQQQIQTTRKLHATAARRKADAAHLQLRKAATVKKKAEVCNVYSNIIMKTGQCACLFCHKLHQPH
ncbi:cation transporter [Flavobacterium sp. J372]|uniref:heavy-metal-associated domain-containing protein n=1 Tax=Flavobacterium sp. J372 TaxID=2898436 RepID=UPI002151321C|nr:heavy-metal-associated domain-containing protein [Flavobacterium sp. J372]MCR5861349.1 cation transporter [Flavobacterium sp. J372]